MTTHLFVSDKIDNGRHIETQSVSGDHGRRQTTLWYLC